MRAALALRSTCILLAIAAVFACMLLPSAALGQQRPEVAYIFPPGGRAGTTVEVRLGGYDFTPDTQLFVLDQRIGLEVLGPPGEMLFPPPPHWFGPKARYKPFSVPREVSARLLLPEDMPAGAIQWQAANANGATVRGEFVVSRGPEEVLEATLESGQHTGAPRKLPALPVTVSGCLERKEEVDEYCFTATHSGPVTCRMPVHRFGHPVYPILTVSDSQGQCVAESADTERIGLVLTFAAKAGETYTLSMHDLDFRGDRSMVYRLTVERAPSVLAAVPAAGRRGTTGRVRFLGYGVATGKAELESVVREVQFPAAPDQDATEENVLFYRLETEFGTAAACRLGLSKIPERSEAGLAEQDSRRINAPSAVTGILEDPFAEDYYWLRAVEGESYRVAVQAEEIGSPLDVSLAILHSDGREEKTIAESDDLPDTTDAGLEFRVPADGDYQIAIGDLSGSAGQPTAIYRLVVTRAEPAFRISVPERAETIIGAEPVVVSKKRRGRGGQAGLLTVEAMRLGGFDAPISLQLIGLPPGISVPEKLEIAQGETLVEIPIPCDEQAPSWATLVTVRATAERDDGTEVADEALVLLAPVMMPRAIVRPYYPDAGRAVHRGATYRAPVVVERLEGYEGDVVLQLASHPDRVRQGISGGDVVAVKGISEIAYPLFLPEWVQIDRTSRISLNALVEVADSRGNPRWLVNRMDRRITMNVEGALLKLNAVEPAYPVRPGQTVEVPLEVLRSAKFRGPVEIALNKSLNQPFQAEPVTIAADQARCVFRVTASRGSWPAGEHPLTIQATGLLSDQEGIVKSETQIILLVEPD